MGKGFDDRLITNSDLWLSGGLFVVMMLNIVLHVVVIGLLLLLLLLDVVSMLLPLLFSLDVADACGVTIVLTQFG